MTRPIRQLPKKSCLKSELNPVGNIASSNKEVSPLHQVLMRLTAAVARSAQKNVLLGICLGTLNTKNLHTKKTINYPHTHSFYHTYVLFLVLEKKAYICS